jgi:hypothetical protein
MWAMLRDISRQKLWDNERLDADEWKDFFTAALKRQKLIRGMDGGLVVLGARTSRMTVKEMSELIELMLAFGAEHDITFADTEAAF